MQKIHENKYYESEVIYLNQTKSKFCTKENVDFILFTSHTPCKYLSHSFQNYKNYFT